MFTYYIIFSVTLTAGSPARTVGWRDPGYIHTSFLKELWPDALYASKLILWIYPGIKEINVAWRNCDVCFFLFMLQVHLQAWSQAVRWYSHLEQVLQLPCITFSRARIFATRCNLWGHGKGVLLMICRFFLHFSSVFDLHLLVSGRNRWLGWVR